MSDPFRLGLAIPLSGPGGIFGPSCEAVAQLAVHELNRSSGLLGREVEIVTIDAGAPVEQVVERVRALTAAGRLDALTGWHISSVRERLAPIVRGRLPYLYTSLHEGGHATPGSTLIGEAPDLQVLPGLNWLVDSLGIRSWAMVGADYIWPRRTARHVRSQARDGSFSIVYEEFVPFGTRDFSPTISRLERADPGGVIMLFVGQDAVHFNRQFGASGLARDAVRFSPLMEENMLLATGAEATTGLYVAAAYFSSLHHTPALDFLGRYVNQHGSSAPPLNNAAESCYEGILALAALTRAANSTDPVALARYAASESFGYEGPRGRIELSADYAAQPVHIARAEGYRFEVLASLTASMPRRS